MGFDHGWKDPKEQAAANEAAEAMERRRQEEDQRTEALAGAIIHGFGLVAEAIRAAAGLPPAEDAYAYTDQIDDVQVSSDEPGDAPAAEPDPDLDGLLDEGGRAAEGDQQ